MYVTIITATQEQQQKKGAAVSRKRERKYQLDKMMIPLLDKNCTETMTETKCFTTSKKNTNNFMLVHPK